MKKIIVALALVLFSGVAVANPCVEQLNQQTRKIQASIDRWFKQLENGELTQEDFRELAKGAVDLMAMEALRLSVMTKSGRCQ